MFAGTVMSTTHARLSISTLPAKRRNIQREASATLKGAGKRRAPDLATRNVAGTRNAAKTTAGTRTVAERGDTAAGTVNEITSLKGQAPGTEAETEIGSGTETEIGTGTGMTGDTKAPHEETVTGHGTGPAGIVPALAPAIVAPNTGAHHQQRHRHDQFNYEHRHVLFFRPQRPGRQHAGHYPSRDLGNVEVTGWLTLIDWQSDRPRRHDFVLMHRRLPAQGCWHGAECR